MGKIVLEFHSRTDNPVTLYDVSFVPDLGFSLFSFHVVQKKHEIILNKIESLEYSELGLRNVREDKKWSVIHHQTNSPGALKVKAGENS